MEQVAMHIGAGRTRAWSPLGGQRRAINASATNLTNYAHHCTYPDDRLDHQLTGKGKLSALHRDGIENNNDCHVITRAHKQKQQFTSPQLTAPSQRVFQQPEMRSGTRIGKLVRRKTLGIQANRCLHDITISSLAPIIIISVIASVLAAQQTTTTTTTTSVTSNNNRASHKITSRSVKFFEPGSFFLPKFLHFSSSHLSAQQQQQQQQQQQELLSNLSDMKKLSEQWPSQNGDSMGPVSLATNNGLETAANGTSADHVAYVALVAPLHKANKSKLRCSPVIQMSAVFNLEAARWMLDKINQDELFVPGIKFQLIIIDSCSSATILASQIHQLLVNFESPIQVQQQQVDSRHLLAIVSALDNLEETRLLKQLLQDTQIPLISVHDMSSLAPSASASTWGPPNQQQSTSADNSTTSSPQLPVPVQPPQQPNQQQQQQQITFQTAVQAQEYANAAYLLVRHFNWKALSLIYNSNNRHSRTMMQMFRETLKSDQTNYAQYCYDELAYDSSISSAKEIIPAATNNNVSTTKAISVSGDKAAANLLNRLEERVENGARIVLLFTDFEATRRILAEWRRRHLAASYKRTNVIWLIVGTSQLDDIDLDVVHQYEPELEEQLLIIRARQIDLKLYNEHFFQLAKSSFSSKSYLTSGFGSGKTEASISNSKQQTNSQQLSQRQNNSIMLHDTTTTNNPYVEELFVKLAKTLLSEQQRTISSKSEFASDSDLNDAQQQQQQRNNMLISARDCSDVTNRLIAIIRNRDRSDTDPTNKTSTQQYQQDANLSADKFSASFKRCIISRNQLVTANGISSGSTGGSPDAGNDPLIERTRLNGLAAINSMQAVVALISAFARLRNELCKSDTTGRHQSPLRNNHQQQQQQQSAGWCRGMSVGTDQEFRQLLARYVQQTASLKPDLPDELFKFNSMGSSSRQLDVLYLKRDLASPVIGEQASRYNYYRMAQYVPQTATGEKQRSRGQFSMAPRMKPALIEAQEGGLSGFTVLANLVAIDAPIGVSNKHQPQQPQTGSGNNNPALRMTVSHVPPDTQFLDLDLARFASFKSECFKNQQLSCRQWTKPCSTDPTTNQLLIGTGSEMRKISDSSAGDNQKVAAVEPSSEANKKEPSLYLVGLFDIHQQVRNSPLECGPIDRSASSNTKRSMQNMEAFLWAIDYVNQNANLLPGVRLNSFIIDTCSSFLRTNQVIANLIREQHSKQQPQSNNNHHTITTESSSAAANLELAGNRMLPSEARIMAFVADNHNDEAVEAIVSMASANRLLTFVTQAKSTKLTELVSGKQLGIGGSVSTSGSSFTTATQPGENLMAEDGSLVSVMSAAPSAGGQSQPDAGLPTSAGADSLFKLDFDSLESALSGGANPIQQQQRSSQQSDHDLGLGGNIVGQSDLLHKQEQLMVRMALPNDVIAEAIVSVLIKMQWNYVSLVYENEPDLQDLHDELIRRLFMREIQLAVDEKIPHHSSGSMVVNFTGHNHSMSSTLATSTSAKIASVPLSKYQLQQQQQLSLMYESILARLLQKSMSGARVVIVLLSQEKTRNLLETLRHFRRENLMPKDISSVNNSNKRPQPTINNSDQLLNVMQWITVTDREPFYSYAAESLGTLALSRSVSLLPEFKTYYDTLTPKNNTRNPWWREYMESIGSECLASSQSSARGRRQSREASPLSPGGNCYLSADTTLAAWAQQQQQLQQQQQEQQQQLVGNYLAVGWEHNGADVINAVFAFANGLEVVRKEVCPGTARGLCQQMLDLLERQPADMLRASSGQHSRQHQQESASQVHRAGDGEEAALADPAGAGETKPQSKLISEMIHEQLQRSTFQLADGRIFDLNSAGDYAQDKLKLYNLRYLQSNSIGFVKVGFYDQQEGLYMNMSKARAYNHMSSTADISLDKIKSQCQDPTVCILDEMSLASLSAPLADNVASNDSPLVVAGADQKQFAVAGNVVAPAAAVTAPNPVTVSPSTQLILNSLNSGAADSLLIGDFSFEALMPLHRGRCLTHSIVCGTDMEEMFPHLVALVYSLELVAARANLALQQQQQQQQAQRRHNRKKVLVRLQANIYDYCADASLARQRVQQLIGNKTSNGPTREVALLDYSQGAVADLKPVANLLHVSIGAASSPWQAPPRQLQQSSQSSQSPKQAKPAAPDGRRGPLASGWRSEKRHELEAMIGALKSVKQWRMIHLIYSDHHHYKDEFIELANRAGICIAKLIWVPHAITEENFDPAHEFSFPDQQQQQQQQLQHQLQQPVQAYDSDKQLITYLDGSSESLSSYLERGRQEQIKKLWALFRDEFELATNATSGNNTKQQQTNLIVLLASNNAATNLIIANSISEAMQNNYVWLTTHEWLASVFAWPSRPTLPEMLLSTQLESYNSEEFIKYLVSQSPRSHAPIPTHLFEEFWQNKFQCLLPNAHNRPHNRNIDTACTGNEQLTAADLTGLDERVYQTIDIVESLHESLTQFIEAECPLAANTLRSLQDCDISPEAPNKLMKLMQENNLMRRHSKLNKTTTTTGDHSSSLYNYHIVLVRKERALFTTNDVRWELNKVAVWRNNQLDLVRTNNDNLLLHLGQRVWSKCLDQWSCQMCQKQIDEGRTKSVADYLELATNFQSPVTMSVLNDSAHLSATAATTTTTTMGSANTDQLTSGDNQQDANNEDTITGDSGDNEIDNLDDRMADSFDALSNSGQFRRSNNHRHHMQQIQMMLKPPLTLNLGHISGVLLSLLSVCGVASIIISMAYLMSQQSNSNQDAFMPADQSLLAGYGTNANLYNYFLLTGLLMLYLINIGFLLPATMGVCWFRRIGLATAYTTIYSSFLLKIISIWRHSQLLKLTLCPKLQTMNDEKRHTLGHKSSTPEERVLAGSRRQQSMRKYNSIVSNEHHQPSTQSSNIDDADIDVTLNIENFDPIDSLPNNNRQQFYNISQQSQQHQQQQQARDSQASMISIARNNRSFKLRLLRLLSPATLVSCSICLILIQIIISLIWFIRQPPQPGYYQAAWRCASITRMPMLFKYEPLICLLYPFILLLIAWLVSAFAYRCSKSSLKALSSKKQVIQMASQVEYRQRYEQVESKLLLITSSLVIFIWSLLTINMISSQSQTYPNGGVMVSSNNNQLFNHHRSHNNLQNSNNNVINNEPTITMLPPITVASSYYDLNIVFANLISALVIYSLMFAYRLFFMNKRLFVKCPTISSHHRQYNGHQQQYNSFYHTSPASSNNANNNNSWWSFLFHMSNGNSQHFKSKQQQGYSNHNQMMLFNGMANQQTNSQTTTGLYNMHENPGAYNDLFTLARGTRTLTNYRHTSNNQTPTTHLASQFNSQTTNGYGTAMQQDIVTGSSNQVVTSSHLAHLPNQPYQSTTLNPLSFRNKLAQAISSRRNSSSGDIGGVQHQSADTRQRNRLSCHNVLVGDRSNNNSRRSSSTCMTELNMDNMGSVGSVSSAASSNKGNNKRAKRSRTSLGQYFIGANRDQQTTAMTKQAKQTKKQQQLQQQQQQQDFDIGDVRSVSRRPSTSAASTTSSTAKLMFDDLLIDDDDGTMSCASSVASSSASQLHGNELYPIDCSIQFETNIGPQSVQLLDNTGGNNQQQQLLSSSLRRSVRSRRSLNSTSLRGVVIDEETNVIPTIANNNKLAHQQSTVDVQSSVRDKTPTPKASKCHPPVDISNSDEDFYEDDEYSMSFSQQNYIQQHFDQGPQDNFLRGTSQTDLVPESTRLADENNDAMQQKQPPQKPKPRTTLIKQQKQQTDDGLNRIDHIDVNRVDKQTSADDEDKEKYHYKL